MDENNLQEKLPQAPRNTTWKVKIPLFLIAIVVGIFLGYFFLFTSPANFIEGTTLEIQPGMSLHQISLQLKNAHIIRSRTAFEAFVIYYGGEKHIKFSNYLFETKMPVYEVAKWIVKGDRYRAPVVVTIPEGFNNIEIADTFKIKLLNFNAQNFLRDAKEGYLFPDTYYFFSGATEADVIDSMSKNFEKKVAPILPEITAVGKSEKDIIIMASILEREAKGDADRGIISGILWKRILRGMPLQVDAAPETYQSRGLPKEPISNPGLEAIHAAIYPEDSAYLYYLHDASGATHYAKTFAEHKKNKAKYLK